ncbi:hypothetical protein HPP92_016666 [Vanilla planifolia]|uniref:BED-type domain-containing protein n=1 Tax=Vanilla planifolia TaxID=51239 RepID=A0A835UTK3_VANPL|nr:hypothetical protein HPP92_016666 [Vanilla planifolia]
MAGGRRRPTDRGIGDDSGCHGFCYRSVVCGFSCRLHLIWPHLDPLGTLILDGNMVLLRMRRRKRKAPKEVLLKMKDNLGGCPVTKKRRLVVKEDEHIVFRTSDDDDDERRYVDYKWKAKEGAISHGVEPSLIAIRSSGFGDPGWEHGIAQDEKKKKVKCNYCNKVVSGGINRFKQHLARIPGEVAFCKMVPEVVYLQMKENMKWHRTGWRRRPEDKEFAASVKLDNEGLPNNANKPVREVGDNNFCDSKQINNGGRSSFAGDSLYFHKMLDLVGRYGQGFKAPSGSEISGQLLQKEAAAIREQVITANTDCFRAAGKLLEEKRKCLFWTPCVAYCTNTILEDILKIKWIEEKGASWTSSYKLPEVIRGLNECITRLELDDGTRVCAVTRVPIISDFVLAKADFGTELALSTRVELDPATWWQQHGISCLELQRIAVRILSQTCMSFGCEHRWSALDHLPYSRKKRMDQSRFNDVAFVHYNLRLRERQMKRVDSNTSLDNFFVESLLGGWVKAPENAALTTDEVIQQNGDDQDVNGLEYFDKGKDSIILTENVETSEVQPGSGVAIKEVDDDADVDQLF